LPISVTWTYVKVKGVINEHSTYIILLQKLLQVAGLSSLMATRCIVLNSFFRLNILTDWKRGGYRQCKSTAQEVWVSTKPVVVSQGVGVSVGIVIGSDDRSWRVDDVLGGGGTNASQCDGYQEKDLKRKQNINLVIFVKCM